jgi:hyaluronoglucosaminidase
MASKSVFKYRGLVEGFYGRPWDLQERLSAFRFLGKCGYNIYYYAPKSDPYHRAKWQEPYPARQAKEFTTLAECARKNGLIFSFALSPGLGIRYSSEKDFDLLLGKMLNARDLGADAFALFLDDISPDLQHAADKAKFKDLGSAHAYLTNKLFRELKKRGLAKHFTMCPTYYCGKATHPYLKRLGASLDQGIEIFWTGPEVCSRELTAEHTKQVSLAMRRKVLYWDNYPVNDSVMLFNAHLGPYGRRDKGLPRYTSGIIANPGLQAEAHKIPLYTIGDYLRDPRRYDPDKSWQKAAKLVAGPATQKAFLSFADHALKSCIHREDSLAFRRDMRKLGYFSGFVFNHQTAVAVHRYLAQAKKLALSLRGPRANRKLARELAPWLNKYLLLLDLFADCISLLDATLQGKKGNGQLAARVNRKLIKAWKDFYVVSENGLLEEIRRIRVYIELVKKRQH